MFFSILFFAYDTNYSFRYTTTTMRLTMDQCGARDRPSHSEREQKLQESHLRRARCRLCEFLTSYSPMTFDPNFPIIAGMRHPPRIPGPGPFPDPFPDQHRRLGHQILAATRQHALNFNTNIRPWPWHVKTCRPPSPLVTIVGGLRYSRVSGLSEFFLILFYIFLLYWIFFWLVTCSNNGEWLRAITSHTNAKSGPKRRFSHLGCQCGILFYSCLLLRGGLFYPRDWQTNVNRRLDCSREAPCYLIFPHCDWQLW
jgi:hypothetical protein